LKELEEKEVVYSEKSGRERYYRLTDLGKQIFEYLSEFIKNMDSLEYGESKISMEEQKIQEYREKIDALKEQLKKEKLQGSHTSQKLESLLSQLEQIEAQLQ
jgi:DNA-binding PadR family transcriptional regulator